MIHNIPFSYTFEPAEPAPVPGLQNLVDGGDVLPQNLTAGGDVIGPGTGHSDSVLVNGSAGEKMMNFEAAKANRSLLNKLNAEGLAVRAIADAAVPPIRRPEGTFTGSGSSFETLKNGQSFFFTDGVLPHVGAPVRAIFKDDAGTYEYEGKALKLVRDGAHRGFLCANSKGKCNWVEAPRIFGQPSEFGSAPRPVPCGMTTDELLVCSSLMDGLEQKEIMEKLDITVGSVKGHTRRSYAKINAQYPNIKIRGPLDLALFCFSGDGRDLLVAARAAAQVKR